MELQSCRVNPDFNSSIRKDLEFYIPQLCSIYMQGDIDHPEQLINLILNSSTQSIFFSHRVWFFLQSLIYSNDARGDLHFKAAQHLMTHLK